MLLKVNAFTFTSCLLPVEVKVLGVNEDLFFTWSDPVEVTPLGAPSQPVITSTDVADSRDEPVVDDGEVAVEWTAPVNNGGSAIESYMVTATPDASADDLTVRSCVPEDVTAVSLSCLVEGLVNGIEYTVVVVATNEDKFEAKSDSVKVMPIGEPSKPVITSPLVVDDGEVTVEWTAPVNDGGSAIEYYMVSAHPTPDPDIDPEGLAIPKGCEPPGPEYDTASDSWSCVVAGLINGIEYTVLVHVSNEGGDSSTSDEVKVTPRTIPEKPSLVLGHGSKEIWIPKNYSKKLLGNVSLRTALVKSLNLPTIGLVDDLDPRNIISYAQRLGITTEIPPNLTIALGSFSVTLQEMVSAYAVYADQGNLRRPVYLLRVEDQGHQVIAFLRVFVEIYFRFRLA